MKDTIATLARGITLGQEESRAIMSEILGGNVSDIEIAAFLALLATRPPTANELTGFREALLEKSTRLDAGGQPLVDLCGTGGDGKNTFNISTLTAFLVAALGGKVAKHGNYSASSRLGSSNLLEGLRVKFPSSQEEFSSLLEKAGVVFLHAPQWHPALKPLRPIREKLGIRTVFNLLGPLVNPAPITVQVVGVPNRELQKIFGEIFQRIGRTHGIVSSDGGYDEIVLCEDGHLLVNGKTSSVTAEMFGVTFPDCKQLEAPHSIGELVSEAEEILKGKAHADKLHVVAANAAIGMQLLQGSGTLREHFNRAMECLRSGEPFRRLELLRS